MEVVPDLSNQYFSSCKNCFKRPGGTELSPCKQWDCPKLILINPLGHSELLCAQPGGQLCHFNPTMALGGAQEGTAMFPSPFSFLLPLLWAFPWFHGWSLVPRVWESPAPFALSMSRAAWAGSSSWELIPALLGWRRCWPLRQGFHGSHHWQENSVLSSRGAGGPLSEGFSLPDPTDVCQSLLDSGIQVEQGGAELSPQRSG